MGLPLGVKGQGAYRGGEEDWIVVPRGKLLHIITDLHVGGAETMLAKLLEHGAASNNVSWLHEVLSLMTPGEVAPRLRSAGARVHTLGMKRTLPSLGAMRGLMRTGRDVAPDLIVGWMQHGYFAAWALSRNLHPRPATIWNVRRSQENLDNEKLMTRAVLRWCASVSGTADAIVYNSSAAKGHYEALGFSSARARVVPNGFETEVFKPSLNMRTRLCAEFGIDPGRVIVGMVARYHPMKNPGTLIEAAGAALEAGQDIHLLLVGEGMDALPEPLSRQLAARVPAGRRTVVGRRMDVADWLGGLDMLVLPSAWGEGFPNILGEALSSGVPCIASNVGDSAMIVGDAGRIVPPREAAAMAAAICELASLSADERHALGQKGRERINARFSIAAVAEAYDVLFSDVLERRASANAGGARS